MKTKARLYEATVAMCVALLPMSAQAGDEVFPAVVTYACERGVQIDAVYFSDYGGEGVVLLAEGQTLVLPQAISASGARYTLPGAVTGYEWWIKGDGAMLNWFDAELRESVTVFMACKVMDPALD